MPDDLHERLTDYLTNLEVTVRPVDGHAHIVAESMADALLPFIQAEIEAAVAAERERWMSLDPS
jgi:hypothetical protein